MKTIFMTIFMILFVTLTSCSNTSKQDKEEEMIVYTVLILVIQSQSKPDLTDIEFTVPDIDIPNFNP